MADQITAITEVESETTSIETNQDQGIQVENGFVLIEPTEIIINESSDLEPSASTSTETETSAIIQQTEISRHSASTSKGCNIRIDTENNLTTIRQQSSSEITEQQMNISHAEAESTDILEQTEGLEQFEDAVPILIVSNQENVFDNHFVEAESAVTLQQTEIPIQSNKTFEMEIDQNQALETENNLIIIQPAVETTQPLASIPAEPESTAILQDEIIHGTEPSENPSPTTLIMPIIYDGSIPWNEWLLLFDVAASMNNWSDNSVKLSQMLMLSLRGPALALCLTLPESTRRDYRALREALSEVLRPEEPLEVLIEQLQQRRRQPQETLRHLQMEVSRMVCQVYGGMDDTEVERHSRVAFLRSIEDSTYGAKTIDAQPKTLEEALMMAEFYERRYVEYFL